MKQNKKLEELASIISNADFAILNNQLYSIGIFINDQLYDDGFIHIKEATLSLASDLKFDEINFEFSLTEIDFELQEPNILILYIPNCVSHRLYLHKLQPINIYDASK